MEQRAIKALLEQVAAGQVDVNDALLKLKMEPFEELGFAKLDSHRGLRQGVAEVIYGAGKTPEQIARIVDAMRSGVVYGNASMIDGMIQRLEDASAPAAAVVATGGNTLAVLRECKRDILYDADLLLDGLHLVYRKNIEAKQKKS